MPAISLPASVISPQDVQQLINEVHAYAAWFNKEIIKHKVHAEGRAGSDAPVLGESTKEVIRDWKKENTLNRRSLEQLIIAIERQRKESPVITVTLAGPATESVQQTIADWCRKTLREDVFISFTFDSSILGGAVVRAGSRLFDLSFRQKIVAPTVRFSEVARRA